MEHESNHDDDQRLAVYGGRHVGWWIKGRSRTGRLFMLTWWPTRRVAMVVSNAWRRVVRIVTGRAVVVDVEG